MTDANDPTSQTPEETAFWQRAEDGKRAEEWLRKQPLEGFGPGLTWGDALSESNSTLPKLLTAYAESECSRLASRVEELEKLIAKRSGSLNSVDSASNTESSSTAKEIR